MVHESQSELAAGATAAPGRRAGHGVGSGTMAAWILLGGTGQNWGRMSPPHTTPWPEATGTTPPTTASKEEFDQEEL